MSESILDNVLFIILFIIQLFINIIFFIEMVIIKEKLAGARLSIMLLEERDDNEEKAFIRYCISVLSSFDTIEEVIDYIDNNKKVNE